MQKIFMSVWESVWREREDGGRGDGGGRVVVSGAVRREREDGGATHLEEE